MTHDHQQAIRRRLLLLAAAVACGCVAGLVVAQAAVTNGIPSLPPANAAVAITNSPIVTNTLAWLPLTNTCFWQAGTTNVTRTTNSGAVLERITITNHHTVMKPLALYVVLNGTNMAAFTTNTTAKVTFPRGTLPTWRLEAQLTDGQRIEYGTFAYPSNPSTALVSTMLERSTNLTRWDALLPFPAQFIATTNRFEAYRAVLKIEPLGTNTALVFQPSAILVTNRP